MMKLYQIMRLSAWIMRKEKIRYEENLYRNRSSVAHNIKMDSYAYFRSTQIELRTDKGYITSI